MDPNGSMRNPDQRDAFASVDEISGNLGEKYK